MRLTSTPILFSISLCTLLFMGAGPSPESPSSSPRDSNFSTTKNKSFSASNLAYMDLALTTTDEYGGEISKDEAFSLYFRSDATEGWDPYDASKKLPRGDTWAIIAFQGTKDDQQVLKAQESRPYKDSVQVVDIKLVQKNMPAATYTISVQTWYSVPSDWSLRLRSQALDTTFVIDEANDTVSFELGSSSSSSTTSSPGHPSIKSSTDTTHISMAGEIGPASTTLPVELARFSGTLNQERAVLQWETVSETNNSGFAIQHRQKRSTGSATNWSRIGFVDGSGTTDKPQKYQFTSTPLASGTHFFRLKQLDRDGTTSYTESLKLIHRPNGVVDLTTAPNPFSSQLTISITPRSSQTVTIQILDMLGRVVQRKGPLEAQGNAQTQTQIHGHRLASGSYLVRIEGKTFTSTQRVMHIR